MTKSSPVGSPHTSHEWVTKEVRRFARRDRLSARVGRDLEPRVERELLHHVANVTLDGMGRDLEPLSNFLVAQPLADERDDLALAWRHPHILEGGFDFAAPGGVHDLCKE